MSLLVVAYPKIGQEDYEWIQSLRIKYDQANYNIVRPHFTIVFPVDNIAENDLIDHVEACVRMAPPIRFVLRAAYTIYDQFADRWLVFLIPDEGNGRLSKLHDSLYTGILADKLLIKIPYIPHVTVAVLKDCQECKDLTAELNRKNLAIDGVIEAVDVVRDIEGGIETISRVELAGAAVL